MASTCPDSFCQSGASTTVAAEPVRSKQIQRNPTKNNVHMAPLQPYHVATDKVWSELTQSTKRRRSTVQARTAADAKRLCSTATQQATAIRFPANYFWHSRLPRVPSCWKTVLCFRGFAFALLEFDARRLRHFINLELLHIALHRQTRLLGRTLRAGSQRAWPWTTVRSGAPGRCHRPWTRRLHIKRRFLMRTRQALSTPSTHYRCRLGVHVCADCQW